MRVEGYRQGEGGQAVRRDGARRVCDVVSSNESSIRKTPAERGSSVATLDQSDLATHARVTEMMDRAESANGHAGLSEPSRLAWAAQGDDFVGLVLSRNENPVGYAHLSWRDGSWTIEIVLEPDATSGSDRRAELLATALLVAREGGASEVRYWANQHHPGDESEVQELGFTVERDLLQMRVPLPLTVAERQMGEGFSLRAFRPGRDEEAWLEVNNRAFAAHPEQGHWDLATLIAREQTSWFDPDGFILCESEGRLAASCWTKVHDATDPPMGEIYVISVDPDFQQRGLGWLLTVAGLDWLSQRVSTGMLYVDKANTGAVTLYRALGFTVDHVDRCYLLDLG
jgi:mycothiol synthase